jgi:hypothetical protein
MKRMIVGIALASVVLNGVALLAGRGSWGHGLLVLGIAIYIAAPALVGAMLAFCFRHRWRFARRVALIAGAVAVVSASLPLSLIPSGAIANRDIAAAKEYCETVFPAIEQYRRMNGVYPRDLSVIQRSPQVPRLMRRFPWYWSDGSRFEIFLIDPRGLMSFISYDSQTGRWTDVQ